MFVRKVRPLLWIMMLSTILCLLQASGREASADRETALARFRTLARKIRNHTADQAKPDTAWIAAMDLLADEAVRQYIAHPKSSDSEIEGRMDRYADALHPVKDGSDFGLPTWFHLHTAHHNDFKAIAVTLGHASRLRLIHLPSKRVVEIPSEFRWLVDWQQMPHFAPDGSLVILSDSVQDAGNRTGTRIDSLILAGSRLRLKKTLIRAETLDWGGTQIHGDQLQIESLKDPQSFYTCAAEALFRRKETYRIVKGDLKLLHTVKQDNVLRAVDQWIFRARHTSHPDRGQRHVRNLFSEEEMLDNYKLKQQTRSRTRVEITFDAATLTFEVTQSPERLLVRLIHAKSQP